MKKSLCILLTLGIAAALAACGTDDTPAASTDPSVATTLQEATGITDETTTGLDGSTVPAESTTGLDGSTNPGETTAETSVAAAAQKPATIAEIVAYYNAAANKVKTAKPGYSFTEQTNINSINGGAKWLVNIVNNAITSDTPQAEKIAKGANHENFAVPGKSWASKLQASAVQSAACTEKGNLYEIRINMKREVRADLPRNVEEHEHGKAFKVYNAGMIYGVMAGYENLGAITKFAPTYHDSYIICTVDKTTGNMKSAQYSLTFDAQIEGKLVSALPVNASASISVTGKYAF